ncbi:MAG TPA: hypothetical protein VGM90_06120 [Kofleriaceae bacterium]|jgi:hypothetical protein
MKIIAAALVVASFATVARADEDDGFDTPKALAGKAWVMTVLKKDAAVDAPTKDKPLDYVVVGSAKECKSVKQGAAKDDKAFAKLRTCLIADFKANGGTEGQWMEIRPKQLDDVISELPRKYAKVLKAQAKDSTIVEGHFSGDGVNTDIFLALDASNHPHALWLAETQFE